MNAKARRGRVVPHVFREEILADRLEWAVIGYRKDARIDYIRDQQAKFAAEFEAWRLQHPGTSVRDALHGWTSANMKPAYRIAPEDSAILPAVGSNFASAAYPRLWLRRPVQTANEIDKVVGFPILSSRYRGEYRRLGLTDEIDEPELRAAITRRVLHATIQPTSTFMNAIRERVSIIQRAGGRSARIGPSYINGAAYNPRVLIALMNIWRVHDNFFDWRPDALPLDARGDADSDAVLKDDVDGSEDAKPKALRRIPVPGSSKSILVPKRRARQVIRTTPAMRMGVHMPSRPKPKPASSEHHEPVDKKKGDRRTDDRPMLPDLARILYQPWLFHGTPMWAKLQGR